MDKPTNPSHSPYEYSTLTGMPTISLEPDPTLPTGDPVNAAAAQLLPEQVCRHFRMIPVSYEDGELTVAMADPSDPMAQNVAYALTNDALSVVLAPPHQIDRAIDRIWGGLGTYEPLEAKMDEQGGVRLRDGRAGHGGRTRSPRRHPPAARA